ncbi:glycosyltransferase, partial [candidate division KSB1 bacterium]|nr:glycosyltransferase [candidate division KSB1 bacterium]
PHVTTNWISQLRQIPKREIVHNITVYYPQLFYLPKKISKMSLGIFLFFRLLPIVRQLHKSHRFQIIHAFGEFPEGFAAYALSALFRLPIIITHRRTFTSNKLKESYFLKKINSYIISNINRNITSSDALSNQSSNFSVVAPGIDLLKYQSVDRLEIRKKLCLSTQKQILIFRGTLLPESGINYLIDAFELLAKKNKNLVLYIIGRGILKDALIRKVSNLKLDKCVTIKDDVDDRAVPLWLNAGDLFILPGINAEFPVNAIKALACGTPVIACKSEMTSEIVPDSKIGLLANQRDCQDLAMKIKMGLARRWNRKLLVKRAQKYNIDDTVQRIQDIYDNCT